MTHEEQFIPVSAWEHIKEAERVHNGTSTKNRQRIADGIKGKKRLKQWEKDFMDRHPEYFEEGG